MKDFLPPSSVAEAEPETIDVREGSDIAIAPVAILHTDRFINRELSILEFNRRVLAQADDATLPLLERLSGASRSAFPSLINASGGASS
jgi:hypothetical protein